MSFQTMPKIDMSIEPIVSSRQITYTLILRQIENRIKEVVAESLVFPNWDDSPFYNSEDKLWRGGIWADDRTRQHPLDPQTAAAQEGDVEEVEHLDADHNEAIMALPQVDKSTSCPGVEASPSTAYARRSAKSTINSKNTKLNGSSTSIDIQSSGADKPRALRSGSFANASSPIVSTDVTNADAMKPSSPPEHSHAMAAIAALSHSNSPAQTPVGSPSRPSRLEKPGSQSSTSSKASLLSDGDRDMNNDLTPQASNGIPEYNNHSDASYPSSPASLSAASLRSEAPSTRSFGSFGHDPRRENSTSSSSKSSTAAETKRLSLAAVTNAAATAKKWGWNALQRNGDKIDTSSEETPTRPLVMGRGQPLPPPGVPLPRPDKKTKTAPIPVPKRKPIPPPDLPIKPSDTASVLESFHNQKHAVPPPPLPKRRSKEDENSSSSPADDGLFVVEAPWVDDFDEANEEQIETYTKPISNPTPPQLPKRRLPHRVLSSSPEEDGHRLPSWMAAQEEEARARALLWTRMLDCKYTSM